MKRSSASSSAGTVSKATSGSRLRELGQDPFVRIHGRTRGNAIGLNGVEWSRKGSWELLALGYDPDERRAMSSGQFHISPCTDEAMLERLLALKDGFIIRAASMSAEALRARFERCPAAFHCVLRSSELVGFFILLPVNEACSEALGGGLITEGRHIRLSDLVDPGGKIAAMYLSVVCAVGPRAQRAAIEGVIATLRRFYSFEGVRLLFARAATETGARMLARLSGAPFEADGRIHSIDLGRYEVITAPC